MSKKKSASQLAAEKEYFEANGIYTEKKQKKAEVIIPKSEKINVVNLGLAAGSKSFGIYISLINNCPQLKVMEEKEIVTKILEEYDAVLKVITRPEMIPEPVKIKQWIKDHCMHIGVCYFARKIIGVDICDYYWVIRHTSEYSDFWFDVPGNKYTSKEMIRCISFRVDKLTEILNEMNNV